MPYYLLEQLRPAVIMAVRQLQIVVVEHQAIIPVPMLQELVLIQLVKVVLIKTYHHTMPWPT